MQSTKIYGAEIIDLALKVNDYLIISDLHLGYEQALNSEGIMVPKFQYPHIISRLKKIQKKSSTPKIIINGDLKHEFGHISRQEWTETLKFIEFLKDNFREIVLVKGNHDHLTPYIAQKTDLEVQQRVKIGDYLVMHGDKIPNHIPPKKTIIIGHEHPSLGLRSGERVEKIKCYLQGKYLQWNLVVMPSFNFISEGSDILQTKPLSPFLKNTSLKDMEVVGVENFEIFPFGKIENIISYQDELH